MDAGHSAFARKEKKVSQVISRREQIPQEKKEIGLPRRRARARAVVPGPARPVPARFAQDGPGRRGWRTSLLQAPHPETFDGQQAASRRPPPAVFFQVL